MFPTQEHYGNPQRKIVRELAHTLLSQIISISTPSFVRIFAIYTPLLVIRDLSLSLGYV